MVRRSKLYRPGTGALHRVTHFIHAGDVHLGKEQYGLRERTEDFYQAFLRVVDHAVAAKVDFVLLTGDLLNKASQPDALALLQASAGLQRLREAGIPVLAIEGNHEIQQRSETVSFPQYLNLVSLMHLLDVQIDAHGRMVLTPWDSAAGSGSFIDLGTTRIYGIRYLGAQTARSIEEIADQVDRGDAEFVIMMLHAGMEGEIPHMHGGLTMGQLAPLRDKVDYIALGHVHKKLEREGWIYNPGSTEVCAIDEFGPEWRHGFFEVEVVAGQVRVHHHRTTDRPFCRFDIDVSHAASADEVVATAQAAIRQAAGLTDGAVVEITMLGVTKLNRHEIPEELIKSTVSARCQPLTVRIRYAMSPVSVGLDRPQHGSREELEREVIEQVVSQSPVYQRHAREWTQVALDVKKMVSDGRPAGAIAEHVRAERERLEPQAGPQTMDYPEEAVEHSRSLAVSASENATQEELGRSSPHERDGSTFSRNYAFTRAPL